MRNVETHNELAANAAPTCVANMFDMMQVGALLTKQHLP
jgi:hypothetical protein